MNTPKWIPKHSADILEVFSDARQLECDLRVLGKKFATNVNINLPDYYVSKTNKKKHYHIDLCIYMLIIFPLSINTFANVKVTVAKLAFGVQCKVLQV